MRDAENKLKIMDLIERVLNEQYEWGYENGFHEGLLAGKEAVILNKGDSILDDEKSEK